MSPELTAALTSYEHWLSAASNPSSATIRYDTRVMTEKRCVLVEAIERLEEQVSPPPVPVVTDEAVAVFLRQSASMSNDNGSYSHGKRAVEAILDALASRPASTPPVPVITDAMIEAAQAAARSSYPGIDTRGGWQGPMVTDSAMRAALTAALATVSPEPSAESLDDVLAEIEGTGWLFDSLYSLGPANSWSAAAWTNGKGQIIGGRGDTPVAALRALRDAIRSQAGTEVGK